MNTYNKNVRTILLKLLLVTVIASILEYLIIIFLSSMPIIAFKAQVILGIMFIAFLLQSGYKIWRLFNLDHPFSKNGKHQS